MYPKIVAKKLAVFLAMPLLILGVSTQVAARSFTVIHSFCAESNCTDGSWPSPKLLLDPSGALYGVTVMGGAYGHGNVFALIPNGSGYDFRVMYDFCAQTNCADGSGATGRLVVDRAGDIYGTTGSGGLRNYGTTFELIPNAGRTSWRYVKLLDFCHQDYCADGAVPSGLYYVGGSSGAPYDGGSLLYGTTDGVIYSGTSFLYSLNVPLRPAGPRSKTVLAYFCPIGSCASQDEPRSLIDDEDGGFFGAAESSGSGGFIFDLSPTHGGFSINHLYDFCQLAQCADGAHPGSVTRDSSGKLYGVTPYGGAHSDGVLFQLSYDGAQWHEAVLHDFCSDDSCSDGAEPAGGVAVTPTGDVYGVTSFEGKCGLGTLFRFHGRTFSIVHNFCGLDGYETYADLMLDSAGDLFGSALLGGRYGGGTVYELTP